VCEDTELSSLSAHRGLAVVAVAGLGSLLLARQESRVLEDDSSSSANLLGDRDGHDPLRRRPPRIGASSSKLHASKNVFLT
jgi:hypothetical protein